MKIINANVLSAPDTASQTGTAIDSSQIYQATFQPIFGDTTVTGGTVSVQMSNDIPPVNYAQGQFTPTNWSAIPNASSAITSGVASPIILSTVSARWLRVVFTVGTAGTSTINTTMFGVCV